MRYNMSDDKKYIKGDKLKEYSGVLKDYTADFVELIASL